MNNESQQPQAPSQNYPSPTPTKKSNKKALTYGLVILLIIALPVLTALYFDNKNNDTQIKLDEATSKISSLKAELDELKKDQTEEGEDEKITVQPVVDTITNDLIPGDADTKRGDGTVQLDALYKFSLNPSEIWIEYGASPDQLARSTNKISEGLGVGDPDSGYATGRSFSINNLESGIHYYYRVAATVDGQTMYSGVASFLTTK